MQLKNIIFDLGGVIINIDYTKAATAFKNLGIVDFDNFYSKAKQSTLFDEFEKGNISNEEFRNKLRSFLPQGISDSQIDACWNAMLMDIPQERFDFLNLIKDKYRIFLLSNTNAIHVKEFTRLNDEKFGVGNFEALFENVYYSCKMGMRKPDAEIFEFVLNENALVKEETIFIDDSIQHINGANSIELRAELLKVEEGEKIEVKYRVLV